MKEIKEQMIAVCGLDCTGCPLQDREIGRIAGAIDENRAEREYYDMSD